MGAITPLIQAISIEATTNLLALGYVFGSFTVADASNASPIVITTSAPHLIVQAKATVVISGVTGNTAANGTWVAHQTGPTTLALYSLSPTGVETPVAGNGAFAGGGLVQTAFSDGGIAIGRVKVDENWAPPRCIFIPRGSRFGPRSAVSARSVSPQGATTPEGASVRSFSMTGFGGGYSPTPTVTLSAPDLAGGLQATAVADVTTNGAIRRVLVTAPGSGYLMAPSVTITDTSGAGATAIANLGPSPEALAIAEARPLWTDFTQFEVQVWVATLTATTPGSYEADFDLGRVVYQTVLAAIFRVAAGLVVPSTGVWVESQPGSNQLELDGHVFKCLVEIATPLLDLSLGYAPPGTRPTATLSIINPANGTPEVGFVGGT